MAVAVGRKEGVWDLRKSNKPWIEFKVVASDGRIYLNGNFTGFNETAQGNICKSGSIVAKKTSAEDFLVARGDIKRKK